MYMYRHIPSIFGERVMNGDLRILALVLHFNGLKAINCGYAKQALYH